MEDLSTHEMAAHFRGADAIVWAAGAGGGNPDRTYAVDRDAAIRSIDAAAEAGVRRYVMVSYFGARPDHGVPTDASFFPYAESKAAADQHLRGSSLDYTILGPSRLTEDPPTGTIGIGTGPGSRAADSNVPRADVAAVIAETLHRASTIARSIEFETGDTPIPDALG